MEISFIIPAHNEEALLGRTLGAIQHSAALLGVPYEIIVANDSSTDLTGSIARDHGACVVDIHRRQIAATRNAGVRAARGDMLFFVDADTMVTEKALRLAVRALRQGAVGGGSAVCFDGNLPLYGRIMERLLPPILTALNMAPGCFLFCTRQAYLAAGGFNEALYWAEEVAFAGRLKRQGRFVIVRAFVITSGRKLRTRGVLEFLRIGTNLVFSAPGSSKRREVLRYWYG